MLYTVLYCSKTKSILGHSTYAVQALSSTSITISATTSSPIAHNHYVPRSRDLLSPFFHASLSSSTREEAL